MVDINGTGRNVLYFTVENETVWYDNIPHYKTKFNYTRIQYIKSERDPWTQDLNWTYILRSEHWRCSKNKCCEKFRKIHKKTTVAEPLF